jgi:hypothetical protein
LTKAAEGDVLETLTVGRYGEGMKLLLLGLLLLVPGGTRILFPVMQGSDSYLVYLTAGCLYVGLGLTVYASVVLWTDD